MNQQQRKYLLDKIKKTYEDKVRSLKKQEEEYPSLSNYLFSAVMQDTLKLKSSKDILGAIKEMALNAKEGQSWLNGERMGFDKYTRIKLNIEDLFVIPKEYTDACEKYEKANQRVKEELQMMKSQYEMLELRINLSSDNVLQSMINEVDDMGNLSLIDTKIKALTSGK